MVYWAYIILAAAVLLNFTYQFTLGEAAGRVLSTPKSMAFGFLLAMMSFKLIAILFLFSEDIFRLFTGLYRKLSGSTEGFSLPARRRFLSLLGVGLAALPFGALLYGMFKGKYNFKVLRYELAFEDLPEAFDGYQITQISDVHSGSFDNREKISYAVDLITQQQSDVIFFTGDMVNNMASEMEPWKELFASLGAKDGMYSVLGNHDYGDYVPWESDAQKEANLERLKAFRKKSVLIFC